ncbi:MAG: hypothetical protein FJX76_16155 [Armatimonadetes bacterium]|nr:hypothetical protein [Armatimonadota bacterium]
MRLTLLLLTIVLLAAPLDAAPARKNVPPLKRTLVTLLDAAGNARVHFTDQLRGLRSATGTASFLASIPRGLAVARATFTLGNTLKGLTAASFLDFTESKIAMTGQLTTPPMGEGSRLDADLTALQDSSAYDVRGKLALDLAVDLSMVPLQNITLDMDSTGTYRDGSGRTHLSVQSPLIRKKLPLKQFHLTLSDQGETMSVDGTLIVVADSSFGKEVGEVKPTELQKTMSEFFEKSRLPAQSLTVDVPTLADDEAGLHVAFTIPDPRPMLASKIKGLLGTFLGKDAVNKLGADLDRMLKLRLDRLKIDAQRIDDVFDLKTDGAFSNADQFVIGYLSAYSHIFDKIEEMEAKRGDDDTVDRVLIRAAAIQLRQMIPFIEQVYQANGTGDARLTFRLENGDGHVRANGDLSMAADLKPMYEAAAKTNFPLMQKQVIKMAAHTQNDCVKIQLSLLAEGPWMTQIRGAYAQAMREVKEAQPFSPLAEGFTLDSATMALRLSEGTFKLDARMHTSDLSPVAEAVLGRLSPDFHGRLDGVEVLAVNRGGKLSRTFDLYFSGVDGTKKMAAQIAKLLRASRNQTRPGRPAQEVVPPALVAPPITSPEGLDAHD